MLLLLCRRSPEEQGWQRRGDAEARGADFDASDGGARRHFKVGGVDLRIYIYYSLILETEQCSLVVIKMLRIL